MDAKLAKVYHSPQGYWRGLVVVKKLSEAAKVSENEEMAGSASPSVDKSLFSLREKCVTAEHGRLRLTVRGSPSLPSFSASRQTPSREKNSSNMR